MEVRVLGGVAVVGDDGLVRPAAGERQRLLLAVLASEHGRTVSTGRLVDALWGDDPPAKPANALQGQVSRLRRLCADAGAGAAVEHLDGGYRLAAAVEVDAERFESLVRAGDHGAALAAWAGEPYPALEDHALDVERRRLDELHAGATEQVLAGRLEVADAASLVGELEALVAGRPLRERGWVLLMTALERAGRRADALDAYQRARRVLAGELGIDPGAELQAAERRILAHEQTEPARLTEATPRSWRTRPAAPLLGRDDELARARHALTEARCVTITGPGGVGKTRLLRELVGEAGERGVLVGLADLGEGVAERVAADLGIRQIGPNAGPLLDSIAVAVDGRQFVLAIDNVEHVTDEAARFVDELLARADVRVVMTSREPVGVLGEQLVPLAPFDVGPDAGRDDPAIELFVQRATARRPDWHPTDDDVTTIVEICRRLDGLPLAIELAAAQVVALTPAELLSRLDPTRLRGRTGGPEHHRSLTSMLDWSYDRLEPHERTMLGRLTVVPGAASLASIEAVAAGGAIDRDEVAPLLTRLVEASLVRAVDVGGQRRFELLGLVRSHVRQRADAADVDAAARQLVAWAIGVAGEADDLVRTEAAGLAWERLGAEHDALLGALEAAERLGLHRELAHLTRLLSWWWFVSGRHDPALPWMRLVHRSELGDPLDVGIVRGIGSLMGLEPDRLTLARDGVRIAAGLDQRWDLLLQLTEAFAATVTGEQQIAIETSERIRAMSVDLADAWLEAAAGLVLGTAHFWSGDVLEAGAVADSAIEVAERTGEPWALVLLLANRSAVREVLGDLGGSRDDIERAIEVTTDRLETLSPEAPIRLADLATLEGHPEEGLRLAREAVRRLRDVGAVGWLGGAYAAIGYAARRLGRLTEAQEAYEQSLAAFRANDFEVGRAVAMSGLGFCAEQLGELERARDLHTDELQIAHAFGDPRAVAIALEGLAAVDAAEGDHLGALNHLAEADRLRRTVGAPLPPGERFDVDRVEAACRSALGDEVVEQLLGGEGR